MSGLVWIGFLLFVVAMVSLDLGVFHRKARAVRLPEALAWTAVWILLALLFNLFVYYLYEQGWLGWSAAGAHALTGRQAALQFFTGYIVEKSLSVDNIFVIAMIFAFFRVPPSQQHRLLIWGVLGAIVLRGAMIAAGSVLIERFTWIIYLFGLLLIVTAAKMLVTRHDNIVPARNLVVRSIRRIYPVTDEFDGDRFFTRIDGRATATPLFMALILVETSDVMFAIDSIPAIFAITRDPFLVFTSNIFAILGLRSLYFALAGLMDRFRYLKMSLAFLLAYIGVKMLLSHHYPISNPVSLGIVVGILAVGVLASVMAGHRDTAALASPVLRDLEAFAVMTYRQARRIVILVVGSTVLLIGVAMLITPGPGLLVIIAGLGILAVEFSWARRWLRTVRHTAGDARDYMSRKLGLRRKPED